MRRFSRFARFGRIAIPLISLLVLAGTTTSGTALAEQGTGQTLHEIGRLDPGAVPDSHPTVETSPVTTGAGEHCEPTKAGSRERRAGAVEACVTANAAPVKPSGRGNPAGVGQSAPASSADSSADDPPTCGLTDVGIWKYTRFGYCVTGVSVLYQLKDAEGAVIGTGTLEVSTSATLPAHGTTWDEHVTVRMVDAKDAVTSLSVKFRSACSQPCTATTTAPWYGRELTVGQPPLSGTVSYASNPAPDTHVQFTTSYLLYVTSPGAQITDPSAAWSNPRVIRCDDAVRDVTGDSGGSASPGCVVPSVMAVVPMNEIVTYPGSPNSGQGGAAAAYKWAQDHIANGWGLNTPLTRAKDGEDDRRAATCGDLSSKPFVPQTKQISTDSCAEFPFASTHEGGSDGAQCAEIVPRYLNGEWTISSVGSTDPSTLPCVRAHVRLVDRQSAEEALSAGYKDQRILESEQFDVDVFNRLTGPVAACLNAKPDAAVDVNGGWISNTTERVPLHDLTNPQGPDGKRAATAQACVVEPMLRKGSEAKGNITGWQDAAAFAQQNSRTEQLDRCHLIARVLGGKGMTLDGGQANLVPCWHDGMNTGRPSMRTYESIAQGWLEYSKEKMGPGEAILYEVTPTYLTPASTIPVSVTMTATVERVDGTTVPLFTNITITNTLKRTGNYNLGN